MDPPLPLPEEFVDRRGGGGGRFKSPCPGRLGRLPLDDRGLAAGDAAAHPPCRSGPDESVFLLSSRDDLELDLEVVLEDERPPLSSVDRRFGPSFLTSLLN